jgi:hypothetical protein
MVSCNFAEINRPGTAKSIIFSTYKRYVDMEENFKLDN